ncbi:MAG: hypothetical protein WAV90_16475, partial [Gordonia amarae]
GIRDAEPGPDTDRETRVADAEIRAGARKAAKRIATAERLPSKAAELLAEIASSTTHALAQITVRTCDVDVSRGPRAALALAFLDGSGVVASYPTGDGPWRRITYVPGSVAGIEKAITALRDAYRGC